MWSGESWPSAWSSAARLWSLFDASLIASPSCESTSGSAQRRSTRLRLASVAPTMRLALEAALRPRIDRGCVDPSAAKSSMGLRRSEAHFAPPRVASTQTLSTRPSIPTTTRMSWRRWEGKCSCAIGVIRTEALLRTVSVKFSRFTHIVNELL